MNLVEMLGSKVRRKIIQVLWKVGSTNLMDLIRKTNSTYNQLIPQLLVLEKEGIVTEQRYGRVRMITLDRENPKTRLLLQALKILDKNCPTTKQTPNAKETKQSHESEDVSIRDNEKSSQFHEKPQTESSQK